MRLRHESDHANEMAKHRKINDQARRKVLQSPDRVEEDGEIRIHYSAMDKVYVVAIIAIGCGTAVLVNNPIFGLSAGSFATIVTYYLRRK